MEKTDKRKDQEAWQEMVEINSKIIEHYQEITSGILSLTKIKEKIAQEGVTEIVQKKFAYFIQNYILHNSGITLDCDQFGENQLKLYLRLPSRPDDEIYFDGYCKDIKVFVESEKTLIVEFEPRLKIIPNLQTSEIRVKTRVKVKGYHTGDLLVNLGRLAQTQKPAAKRINIGWDGLDYFYFMPLANFGEYIQGLKRLAEYLGEYKINKLAETERNYWSAPAPLKQAAKDLFSSSLLYALGVSFFEK